jgi:hypothetical protein
MTVMAMEDKISTTKEKKNKDGKMLVPINEKARISAGLVLSMLH